MNKNLYILSFFSILFMLTWCQNNINQVSEDVILTWDILSQDIKVTDPEVLKELQFMRDEEMLTEEDYQKYLRSDNMPIIWGSKMSEQYYPSCLESYCDGLIGRIMIQNMIKERESKPIKVTDPEVIKELRFMKKQGMIEPAFYELLLHEGAPIQQQSGDVLIEWYLWCDNTGCDKIIPRAVIQQKMKEISVN